MFRSCHLKEILQPDWSDWEFNIQINARYQDIFLPQPEKARRAISITPSVERVDLYIIAANNGCSWPCFMCRDVLIINSRGSPGETNDLVVYRVRFGK